MHWKFWEKEEKVAPKVEKPQIDRDYREVLTELQVTTERLERQVAKLMLKNGGRAPKPEELEKPNAWGILPSDILQETDEFIITKGYKYIKKKA